MIVCLGLLMLLVPSNETSAAVELEKEEAWIRLRESSRQTVFVTGEVARLEVESILQKVKAITPDGYTVDSLLEDVAGATDSVTRATMEKIEWVNDLKPSDQTWDTYIEEVATSATETVTSVTREKVKWVEGEYEKRRPEIEKTVQDIRAKTETVGRQVTSGTLKVIGDFRRGWESGGEKVRDAKPLELKKP